MMPALFVFRVIVMVFLILFGLLVLGISGLSLALNEDVPGIFRVLSFFAGFASTALAMPLTLAVWLDQRRAARKRKFEISIEGEPLKDETHYQLGDDGELVEFPEADEKPNRADTHH